MLERYPNEQICQQRCTNTVLYNLYFRILSEKFVERFLDFKSHTQQGRQREPNVKALPFSLSDNYFEELGVDWRNLTPGFALLPHLRYENINK